MRRHGHKFDPSRISHLESEERRSVLDPAKVLPLFRIGEGWTVIDIGCGPGVFTFPMAGIVGPAGKVYAVDLEPRMLERLEERIVERNARNIEAVLSTEDNIPLKDGIADFILMSSVLHELKGNGTLLETRRLLRESGTLGVIDWKKKAETIGPPKRHRLSERDATSLLKVAGFEPGLPIDLGKSHYGFAAKKA